MTEDEITRRCWDIYDKACDDIWKLVSGSGYKVFFDDYAFHRYVKHQDKDGIILNGNELMERIIDERQKRGDKLIFMTEQNIEAEKKHIIASEIKEMERQIANGKSMILEAEERLIKLRNGEFNDN